MELTPEEKELIIVCLLNSIADPEQEPMRENVIALYNKLKPVWCPDVNYPLPWEVENDGSKFLFTFYPN